MPNTTTTKKPRKRMRNVTIVCNKCHATYNGKASSQYCPTCRVSMRPQKQPKPVARPPRPQRPPRQPKPQHQEQMAEAVSAVKHLALEAANPASRLANRTANNRTLLRPNGGARSAVERLLLQVLDPAASSGQKSVRINVDQIQLPKLPIQFDNNFLVSSDAPYKIMLIASPVISAQIYSESATLSVIGARYISIPNSDSSAYNYYVFNNKLGFLADLDPRFFLTPKEDFRRFRMIAASMRSQWAGPEILKQGVAVTARLTDKENLDTFDPNQKPDCVISNNSDVLVSTCQHSEPVFTFSDVDENNDAGEGVRPNPETEGFASYSLMLSVGASTVGALAFNSVTSTNGTTLGNRVDAILNAVINAAANPPYTDDIARVVNALAAKYAAFRYQSASTQNSYSCLWRIMLKLRGNSGTDVKNVVKTLSGNNVTDCSDQVFLSRLLSLATGVGDATNFPTGTYVFNGYIQIVLKIPLDGGVNERAVIPQPIAPPLAANQIGESTYYDDAFLQPVTQVTGATGANYTFQYQTSHSFEFVLSDTTVLGTAAVATTPVDPENVVSKATFDKYQKIMKGMPPAHILTDAGLSRTTMAQMASRGIIKDIYNLAAPIAGALFPGIKPFTNAAKPLVDAIDSAI